MQKFLIPDTAITGTSAVIDGQDAKHICRVLRLEKGDDLSLTNGKGTDYQGCITDITPSRVTLELTGSQASTTESPLHLTVCSGMLKHQKMDEVIKGLTQLGVTEWIPFFCERAIPTPASKALAKRTTRWQTIARESIKQCRRSTLVAISSPQSFDQVLDHAKGFDRRIAFWEESGTPLSELVSPAPAASAILLIGPEGGFSKAEITRAEQAGFTSYSLGPRILRAETAALCSAALVQHLMGDI